MDVMDDLVKLFDKAEAYPKRMEKQTEQWLKNLHKILYGDSGTETDLENKEDLPSPSPQQTIKRVKRLSSLEEEEADDREGRNAETKSNKKSNEALLSSAHGIEQEKQNDKIVPVPTPRGRTPIVKPVEPPKTGNSDDKELMPPPLPRSVLENVELFVETIVNTSGRPKRAAKSKSEKNFKEPSLNTKLRQPNVVSVKVKLEEEQRQSQMKISTANASTKVDESVIVLPSKKPSTVKIDSDSEEENLPPTNGETEEINNVHTQQRSGSLEQSQGNARSLRIRIKREKISLINKEEVENDTNVPPSVPLPIMTKTKSEKSSLQETCMSQNVSNTSTTKTNATVAGVKKGRKKKNAVPHKPIKVERFSVLENPSPVASRTRRGGSNQTPSNDDPEPYSKPQTTIYEDAIEIPPLSKEGVAKTVSSGVNDANANETFNVDRQAGNQGNTTFIVPTLANDATFKITSAGDAFEIDSNLNSTLTLQTAAPAEAVGNATFDVPTQNGNKKGEDIVDQRSFETAKDASLTRDSSLITEDDSPEQPVAQQLPQSKLTKTNNIFKSVPTSSKSYKLLPGRSYELFNPLAQSPVKMRVEAFENAAVAAKAPATTRITRLKKETSALTTSSNGSSITPNIGKLGNPALGRFLTPTETANRTTNLGATKKITSSASKATMPLHKSTTASSLKNATVMGSMKNLQREYSADDVRKALKSQSEERKKQREQKHLLAAQQREAKERERAERFAKLAQEREEKRLKRQAEQEERKKREIEEMNRKLRLQEESAAVAIENKLKTAKAKGTAHEHEMAKQRMMPPPPKLQTKYRFEMLHEDDSTDEEGKTTYKRPPPPIWSRSHERGPAILMQQHTPLDVIDSFFSVQPLTANLKILFPTIDDRHLKRNSSVLWSTPPRYSELPKY